MCGIAGIYSAAGRPVDLHLLEAMTQVLAHRGPDGEGYVLMALGGKEKPVPARGRLTHSMASGSNRYSIGFGHRRLAIVDLTPLGHQPMASENDRIWITYNGEIYNYRELRHELKQRGYQFRSGTDTEVILQAYLEWGDECLSHLNGMFAFALWDAREDRLFCARDRFGIKPFYYCFDGERLLFASEIKSLLQDASYRPSPEQQAVYDYLVYAVQDHTDRTFFSGIKQLKPGHSLLVRDGTLTIRPWWDLKPLDPLQDPDRIVTTFRERFEEAIRLNLRSDVPIGSCLSGGIDSSSIVCTVHKLLSLHPSEIDQTSIGGRIRTFSSCFEDSAFDERPYIRAVVKRTGAEGHEVFPDGRQLFDELPRILWHQEEPFAGTSIMAQWAVMRLAANSGVKVLLDGQGADELLAGYPGYLGSYGADLLRQWRWSSFLREWKAYRKEHVVADPTIAANLLRGFFPASGIATLRSWVKGDRSWLDPDFGRRHRWSPASTTRFPTRLENHLYSSLRSFGLPALLHYEDRNAMAFSVEARVPFLDHRLVEWLVHVPPEFKIRQGMTKFVLREAMAGILPEEVRLRTDKMGFVTPQDQWLRVVLRPQIEAALESDSMRARPYWRAPVLKKWYRRYCDGRLAIGPTVWRWVNLEWWLRRFCD